MAKNDFIRNGEMPAMPPNAGWEHPQAKGLTKREYFAGLAMQGILASDTSGSVKMDICVKISVEHADALLAELEK